MRVAQPFTGRAQSVRAALARRTRVRKAAPPSDKPGVQLRNRDRWPEKGSGPQRHEMAAVLRMAHGAVADRRGRRKRSPIRPSVSGVVCSGEAHSVGSPKGLQAAPSSRVSAGPVIARTEARRWRCGWLALTAAVPRVSLTFGCGQVSTRHPHLHWPEIDGRRQGGAMGIGGKSVAFLPPLPLCTAGATGGMLDRGWPRQICRGGRRAWGNGSKRR
jgi:hypothetical protein